MKSQGPSESDVPVVDAEPVVPVAAPLSPPASESRRTRSSSAGAEELLEPTMSMAKAFFKAQTENTKIANRGELALARQDPQHTERMEEHDTVRFRWLMGLLLVGRLPTAAAMLACLTGLGLAGPGLVGPSVAEAQAYVGVGVGPAVRMDDWPTQLRAEQEIGYYFSGNRRGFFLAFAPSQSWFGNSDWWILVFPLRLGGTFNLFRNSDVTFQMGGTGTLGVAISDQFNSRRDIDAWFHLSFGLMLRLLLMDERLAIYVRPVEFEFGISDTGRYGNEGVRYVLVGGIQYYF